MRHVWIAFGFLALALGFVGVFLPILPTTPFILLAVFAFGRGSPRLQNWLIHHPRFGPSVQDWRQRGAISRKAKRMALISMVGVFALSLVLGVRPLILAIQGLCLLGAGTFIATRPD